MKILIAGDFCPQNRISDQFEKGNFEAVLGGVKTIIKQADYAIVNFECPVCNGNERPIEKCGPNLKCSESGIAAVKWAGFDCVTLANNHLLDYGEVGVSNTLTACQKYQLDISGGGSCLEDAQRILYKNIQGKILAIVNCCEREFSIATETTAGSNPLNPIQQYYSIKEARSRADHVVVIVHGGHEYYQLPSTRMQDTYRFFIDAGADAVINHHQHCYSGMEMYNGKPIFYGLGNFLFDTKNKANANVWHDGYMVRLVLEGSEIDYEIIPYRQCDDKVTVRILSEDAELSAFKTKFEDLSSIIQNHNQLVRRQKKFYSEQSKGRLTAFEPWQNKILRSVYSRGLLPSFVKGKVAARMLNYVECESHRDVLNFALKKTMEDGE